MRSGYFSRMRAASALRFSKGWSCPYEKAALGMLGGGVWRVGCGFALEAVQR